MIKKIELTGFEYTEEPHIIFEDGAYAVLYKPRGLPTAPLRPEEKDSLLHWFLHRRPEAGTVCGKKEIEAGLIHRLDTPTCGLILIAKTQPAFDALNRMQEHHLIEKTYFAFTEKNGAPVPPVIESQFRSFGPKGKKTAPVFRGSKKFEAGKKMYTTTIIGCKETGGKSAVTCSLTQGFRHQVRVHLASVGMPICGDALYNPSFGADFSETAQEKIDGHRYPLQLYAVGISFPDLARVSLAHLTLKKDIAKAVLKPHSAHKPCKKNETADSKNLTEESFCRISFSLPQPDKMIL